MASFEKEKGRVELLMERLGLAPDEYVDPNTTRAGETGADVIAIIARRRIGIQVTDLDTGEAAGKARAAEAKLARDATARGSTYGTWTQNDASKLMAAIARSLMRKSRMSFAGFDEFWLLMCAGVPEWGAIGATFVVTPWLTADALDAVTLESLAASKYTRAFIHAALGVEDHALYQWHRGAGWSKSKIELAPAHRAPDSWDYRDAPDLLSDPEGWCAREVKRVLAELRGTGDADTEQPR
jgi:hypothetical protein